MDDLILALDFGGTKLSAAMVRRSRLGVNPLEWEARQRVYTPFEADAADEQAAMNRMIVELLAGRTPALIGISFGGPVDYETGMVRLSHHVSGWENTPLAARMAAEFGAPAVVDNDANVAALGEHRFGAGRGYRDLMYLTVSTGVGGGWVLGGHVWRGNEGMAGEIGHTVVDPSGPFCLCGKRGCVERLASGRYMAADARQWLNETPSAGQVLRARVAANEGEITGQLVAEAAAMGDALAREILLRGAWALGTGIGNAANLINPQRFVLGGGVTKAGDMWWAEVRRAARATALPEIHFDIVPAELGDDAPLWGAVALALEAA